MMAPSDQGKARGEMMPHSGGAVRQPWPINSSAAAQKDATDTPLQRGECSGCGACFPFDLASLIRGRCATASWGRSRATTASSPSAWPVSGWAWSSRGPDPYSIRYRHRGTLLGGYPGHRPQGEALPDPAAGPGSTHRPHHGHGERALRRRRFAPIFRRGQ